MDSITEVLSDIDKDINTLKTIHSKNNYLRILLEHALIPDKKFCLPEGNPPFKSKAGLTPTETKGSFWQEARKLDVYTRKDIKPLRLETLFIQALEGVDAESAKILLAVKDQTLDKIYPNITLENLKEIGYLK